MRLHRFYIEEPIGSKGEVAVAGTELAHQLHSVFRYKPGQEVLLFDGSGAEFSAEMKELKKDKVIFIVTEKREGLVPVRELSLCFALVKKDNSELIIQKATELGATNIYPVITERSEKKNINMERAQRIVREAAEQSGWAVLPQLHEPVEMETAIALTKDARRIVFDADAAPLGAAGMAEADKTALFIGPEGGFTDAELALCGESGMQKASLGKQTLRAETAAIAALSRFLL